MRVSLVFMAFGFLAAVSAAPPNIQRIVGGEVTSIDRFPMMTSILFSSNLLTFFQMCGGAVLNSRAILSAAHCFWLDISPMPSWRVRVGSTLANRGGVVHHLRQVINHPGYLGHTLGNDISILYTATTIVFNELVQPMVVAGRGYNLPDNATVVAIGWGDTYAGGVPSEQLREVKVYYINQAICRARFQEVGIHLTNDMLCSGLFDVGGRDQCQGDSGGPLIHEGNVVVGLSSWGGTCASPRYPGVNTRVASFTEWIQKNA